MCLYQLQKVCWYKYMAGKSSEALNIQEHDKITPDHGQHLDPCLFAQFLLTGSLPHLWVHLQLVHSHISCIIFNSPTLFISPWLLYVRGVLINITVAHVCTASHVEWTLTMKIACKWCHIHYQLSRLSHRLPLCARHIKGTCCIFV